MQIGCYVNEHVTHSALVLTMLNFLAEPEAHDAVPDGRVDADGVGADEREGAVGSPGWIRP